MARRRNQPRPSRRITQSARALQRGEGLSYVEARRLVKQRRNEGPQLLEEWLGGKPTAASLMDFVMARGFYEVPLAGMAAKNADALDLKRLEDVYAEMCEHATPRPEHHDSDEHLFFRLDAAFHFSVALASHSRMHIAAMAELHRVLPYVMPFVARPDLRSERGLPEHKRILTAIVERDYDEAVTATLDHMGTIYDYASDFSAE